MKHVWLTLSFALASGAGCFHHQAYLPGVIDMRTDGSGLPAARTVVVTDPKLVRPGVEGLAQGAGVSSAGRDVTVEDRHYWIFGSIPIYNESPTPELVAARDAGGALTGVQVGEDLDAIDIVASIFVPFALPMASWVLPSFTFHAHARAATWRPGDALPDPGELSAEPDELVAPREP